jgi:hypothetical protein
MKYDEELLLKQLPLVKWFIYHLVYYRGLRPHSKALNSPFWAFTTDRHLSQATIYWCMVFGVRKTNPTHWKNLSLREEDDAELEDEFTKAVLNRTGWTTKDEWTKYWEDMVDFRNKYVVHRDRFRSPVPQFDKALQVAYAYDEWVRMIFPGVWEEPPFEQSTEKIKKTVQTFVTSFFENGQQKE